MCFFGGAGYLLLCMHIWYPLLLVLLLLLLLQLLLSACLHVCMSRVCVRVCMYLVVVIALYGVRTYFVFLLLGNNEKQWLLL